MILKQIYLKRKKEKKIPCSAMIREEPTEKTENVRVGRVKSAQGTQGLQKLFSKMYPLVSSVQEDKIQHQKI